MCFDFLYNFLSETFLILRRDEQDMITTVHTSVCMCSAAIVVVRLHQNSNFLDRFFSECNEISNFTKLLPIKSRIISRGRTDRLTDTIEANRRFTAIFRTRLKVPHYCYTCLPHFHINESEHSTFNGTEV